MSRSRDKILFFLYSPFKYFFLWLFVNSIICSWKIFVVEKYLLCCLYEYDSFSKHTIHASRKLKEFKLFPLSVNTQIPPPFVPDFLHSSSSHFYYFLGLSDTMVGAELIKPLFPFPFYGHFISEFHITTHGFLSLSSRLHDYIYKTQYIAPLRIKVIFTKFIWVELGTLEWWISGLMLIPLFLLISGLT